MIYEMLVPLPKSMILGNDTLCLKVCIGNIALESVPLAILSNLLR